MSMHLFDNSKYWILLIWSTFCFWHTYICVYSVRTDMDTSIECATLLRFFFLHTYICVFILCVLVWIQVLNVPIYSTFCFLHTYIYMFILYVLIWIQTHIRKGRAYQYLQNYRDANDSFNRALACQGCDRAGILRMKARLRSLWGKSRDDIKQEVLLHVRKKKRVNGFFYFHFGRRYMNNRVREDGKV